MSSTVDANILVYASNESAKEHARAKNLVDGLVAGPALTTLFWPVLLSYWGVPNLQVINRDAHAAKCAEEAQYRGRNRKAAELAGAPIS